MLLPLVEYPFERGAVAQLVGPGFGGDAAQDRDSVDVNGAGGLVGLEAGLEGGFVVEETTGGDAFVREEVGLVAGGFRGGVVAVEGEGRSLFVVEVQRHERFAPRGPPVEVGVEGQPGELAFQG